MAKYDIRIILVVILGRCFCISHAMKTSPKLTSVIASEGSLVNFSAASALAAKPGSEAGFYNPKRRVGRDMVVLSVAQWLLHNNKEGNGEGNSRRPVPRLLDATCAAGVQGLRTAVESPLLANLTLAVGNAESENGANAINGDDGTTPPPPSPMELHVTLNDMDENVTELASSNAKLLLLQTNNNSINPHPPVIQITQRVAQALLHEQSYEISVLDAFGSAVPLLDAAFARAPHKGLIEVCATDVSALYGSRPIITKRHYGGALFGKKRPPVYRERGVRLLLGAIAQAAGRHDRGIVANWSVSHEHFCLVSVSVVRGARGSDASIGRVRQCVRICTKCGEVGKDYTDAPQCGCDSQEEEEEEEEGVGRNAMAEGPLWVGPIYDSNVVREMASMAKLKEAEGFISKETRKLLDTLESEALVTSMFHRRPKCSLDGRNPKLDYVLKELRRRGYKASRTHFDGKAIKTDAGVKEFDLAVEDVLARPQKKQRVSS